MHESRRVRLIVKPVDQARLMMTVKRAFEFWELRRENVLLTENFLDKKLKHPEAFSEIITQNEKMRSIASAIAREIWSR